MAKKILVEKMELGNIVIRKTQGLAIFADAKTMREFFFKKLDTLKRKERKVSKRKKRKMEEKEQVPPEEEKIKNYLCFKTKAIDLNQYPCEIKCSSAFAQALRTLKRR